jgi:hypothetical protein
MVRAMSKSFHSRDASIIVVVYIEMCDGMCLLRLGMRSAEVHALAMTHERQQLQTRIASTTCPVAPGDCTSLVAIDRIIDMSSSSEVKEAKPHKRWVESCIYICNVTFV